MTLWILAIVKTDSQHFKANEAWETYHLFKF